METVFDHNITDEEKRLVCIGDKDDYLGKVSETDAIVDLAYLYYYRGDEMKAEMYIEQTDDVDKINSFWRTVKHT